MSGVIDNGIYWHSILTSLFQGGAIAMALAAIARLLSPREWRIRGVDMRLANGTMVALLAVWNVMFAVLAGLTGVWQTWGFSSVSSISLTVNKAMFGTFALAALVLMVLIRYRYGPGLWNDLALRVTYVVLGIIVAGVAVVSGSLGGEASLLGTALSPVWDWLGVVPRYPMVLPVAGGIVLVVIALIVIALSSSKLVLRRTR